MVNRIDSLLRGVGKGEQVLSSLTENSGSESEANRIKESYMKLCSMLTPDGKFHPEVLPIIACIMNADFMNTGYLWRSTDNGTLERTYFSHGSERETIASLLVG